MMFLVSMSTIQRGFSVTFFVDRKNHSILLESHLFLILDTLRVTAIVLCVCVCVCVCVWVGVWGCGGVGVWVCVSVCVCVGVRGSYPPPLMH